MTSIAELGIRVDSGEAAGAAADLDKLTAAGIKAEKAAAGVSTQSSKTEESIGGLGKKTRETEGATKDFTKQTDAAGMSAKAMSAALRGVPAQFTDIFVSLQGGQAPLTVLLQQGGQLKDMFGGIGPAARAMGGYVLGLVNPFTVAAAAAGVLTYAYYTGSEEAVKFQKALTLSGNAAGTTSDELATMAKQVSMTVGTTGAAAEVLTTLASSGKIAAGSFESITEAALQMERATGHAIDETVADFVKIAKDPVAAAKELNEQYNFLTAGVYAQIVALKEQGNTIGAAKLLTDTYVDTIKNRSSEVTDNLSIWEYGWKKLKGEIALTADAVKNIGRDQALATQITEARQRVAAAQSAVNGSPIDTDAQRKLTDSKLELDFLIQQKNTQDAIAKAQGNYAKEQRDSISAQDSLHTSYLAGLDKEAKKKQEILLLDQKRAAALKGDGADPDRINREYDVSLKAINERYKPSGGSSAVNLTAFNDEKNALTALVASYDNAQKEIEAQQRAGVISQETYSAQRAVLIRAEKDEVTQAYEAQIGALEATRDKTSTTAAQRIQLDQRIADARANMVKAQQTADSELAVLATNEQGRLAKQALAVKTYTDALQQQVSTLRTQGQREAASLGMGDRARSLTGQQNAIDDRFNQQRLELANQYGDGSRGMSLDEYNQKLRALQTTQQDLRDTVVSNYDAMTAAQGDWTAGASAAWQNYQDNALNVAGQMKTAFTSLFDGLTDAAVDWAFGAEESFGDVLVSFGKMILKMELQVAASSVFSGASGGAGSLLGSIGTSLFSSLAGGSGSLGATQAGYSPSYFPQGRATGGNVAPNTLYQVNENGPELYSQGGKSFLMTGANGGSVTPLTSGGAGMGGGGGSGTTNITVNVAKDGSTTAEADSKWGVDVAGELRKTMIAVYKEQEAKSLSSQGNIRNAVNGRAMK